MSPPSRSFPLSKHDEDEDEMDSREDSVVWRESEGEGEMDSREDSVGWRESEGGGELNSRRDSVVWRESEVEDVVASGYDAVGCAGPDTSFNWSPPPSMVGCCTSLPRQVVSSPFPLALMLVPADVGLGDDGDCCVASSNGND